MDRKRQKGSALIETSLVLPILVATLLLLATAGYTLSEILWSSSASYTIAAKAAEVDQTLTDDEKEALSAATAEHIQAILYDTTSHKHRTTLDNSGFSLFELTTYPTASGRPQHTTKIRISADVLSSGFSRTIGIDVEAEAAVLKHGRPLPIEPGFTDSGAGPVSCCGQYGTGASFCIVGTTYQCSDVTSIGYVD